MRNPRVYLDTSVISGLDQQDDPTRMAETHRFWEQAKMGKFEIVISDVTIAELNGCNASKAATLFDYLLEVDHVVFGSNEEAQRLGDLYIEYGGLPPKSRDDALHIAIATLAGCDALLSWNFKHIVNLRAMRAVDAINIGEGHRLIKICQPAMLEAMEDD